MSPTRVEEEAMLNSFAKDWKCWSMTERVVAELVGLAWICSLVVQVLPYIH
jgi:hypothetical protein